MNWWKACCRHDRVTARAAAGGRGRCVCRRPSRRPTAAAASTGTSVARACRLLKAPTHLQLSSTISLLFLLYNYVGSPQWWTAQKKHKLKKKCKNNSYMYMKKNRFVERRFGLVRVSVCCRPQKRSNPFDLRQRQRRRPPTTSPRAKLTCNNGKFKISNTDNWKWANLVLAFKGEFTFICWEFKIILFNF